MNPPPVASPLHPEPHPAQPARRPLRARLYRLAFLVLRRLFEEGLYGKM
jgi:hypothetical protein